MADMLDLPDVLRSAGLPVDHLAGWETAGRDYKRIQPRGVVVHDDVIPARVSTKSRLNLLRYGYAGLPGPLAHVGLTKDGTWHLVATGRANHAGRGGWQGVEDGNGQMLGVECAWAPGESYPPAQIDSLVRGCAAIATHFGFPERMICMHREWAPGRKVDMSWRGPLRESVALHVLANAGVGAGDLAGIPSQHLPDPPPEEFDVPAPDHITGRLETRTGNGAWLLQYDGGIITEGDAPYLGSYPGLPEAERQGERGFYVIEPYEGGYMLVATDRSRYHFPAQAEAA